MSEQKICPTCGTEYPLSERFCPRDGTALRAASTSGDLLGQIIADRYHILKKLGEGGMGTVYLAEHVKMGRKSALKVMNPGMNTDPDAIARFNREASNASRLSHVNICGIYDFGETPDGLIYLAMEFIEGTSLTELIEKGGQLPAARAGSIVHQTADALQVAHDAGIVHRDLKPDNIMIARTREGGDLVKVVDFGIAKASSSEAQNVTRAGLVVGTPEYMSPEQLAADKLDGRSDIYSLGLVAFNCLTGKLPFPSESAQEAMIMRLTEAPRSLAEMHPGVEWPAEVQATIDKALARDVAERYQSAAQFGREFAAAIAEMPAAKAAEGATMVIGAQTAASDAATKAVAAVPATRVAGKSPARGAAVAPAPAPRRNLVPILGGGGALVAAGVFAYMKLMGPGAADPTTTPPTTAAAAETTAKAPTDPGVTPLSNPGSEVPTLNPGGSSTRTNPGTTNPGTTTPPPASGNPTPNVMTRLENWVLELQDPSVSRTTARRINGEIETLRSSLSGSALAESWYVGMIANTVLEDVDGVCAAARQVKALHRERSRLSAADLVLGGCPSSEDATR